MKCRLIIRGWLNSALRKDHQVRNRVTMSLSTHSEVKSRETACHACEPLLKVNVKNRADLMGYVVGGVQSNEDGNRLQANETNG